MIRTAEPVIIMTQAELEAIILQAAKAGAAEVLKQLPTGSGVLRPPHVNQSQAAEMMGLSRQTVARMISAGTIKLNACGLIPINEIDRAIAAGATQRKGLA